MPGTSTSRRYTDAEAAAELRRHPGRYQTSADPFEATHETVIYMCQLVGDSLEDGIVQVATQQAEQWAQMPRQDWAGIWWWVKQHLQFVHHSKMLGEWIGMPDELQLLIRPDALLKMKAPKGDCAVYTMLVCAMLDSAGVPWEIVTVAVDPRMPGVFSHVYPRAILPDGSRVVLDASHGKWPGWEVPAERVTAKQVWTSDGAPIDDLDSGYRGLHGMDYMYPSGMGDDGTTVYDPSTDTLDIFPPATDPGYLAPGSDLSTFPVQSPTIGVNLPTGASPTTGTGTGLSPSEVGALNSLASQMTSIFGATQGVTQVQRNANGSYSLVAPVGANVGTSMLGTGTATSSTWLVLGGLVLAGILMMSMMGGGRR